MHKKLVLNTVSRLLLITCFVMMAPLGWAAYDDLHSLETRAFAVTIVFGFILSLFLLWRFQIETIEYDRINAKDGLAIVGLCWISMSAFGALPLYLSQIVPSYTDAFFEITSGFTTTGASIFTNIEQLPRGILFWRSLTHWLGGMGIIVLYLALLPALGQAGQNAFRLYKAEAPGLTAERIQPRIKETAKVLWTVYFLLSFLETVLLMLGDMPLFDALCHTFGTMATGGFSTRNASIGAYSAYIQWVITFFMFLAGANFVLHYQALKGNVKEYFKSEEFRIYLLIILILIPIFAFVLIGTGYTGDAYRDSAFQIIAMLTTTGYTTVDFNLWPHMLRFLMVMLMFVGGCGGSTGGGMKVIRVMLAIKIGMRSVVQAIFPNAVLPIRVNTVPIASRLVAAVSAYFVIFIFLFFFGTVVLTITESCDLVTAFSASIAALSNIGPGLGQVGAAHNYAWVSTPGKWFLTFLMLAGRLELYSILILFLPNTWRK